MERNKLYDHMIRIHPGVTPVRTGSPHDGMVELAESMSLWAADAERHADRARLWAVLLMVTLWVTLAIRLVFLLWVP